MKKYLLIIIPCLVITFFSCNDTFLEENPPHILTGENLFQNTEGFESALNGLYSLVRKERSGGAFVPGNTHNFPYFDIATLGNDNSYSNFYHNRIIVYNNWGEYNNSLSSLVSNTWAWLYQIVNTTNTIITRAGNQDIDWTESEKNRIVAEARLIRAWAYRHLTFIWGDVPLTLTETVGSDIKTDWGKSSVEEIRNAMEDDLIFAEQNLPETSSIPGKLVKGVATHYLAELYLTQGKNEEAKQKAQALINSGTYSLVTQRYGVQSNEPGTPFTDMFLDGNSNKGEGNTEALWVWQHENNVVGGGTNIMRRWWVTAYDRLKVGGKSPIRISVENGGRGLGRAAATKYAVNLYEEGDDRGSEFAWRKYWIINNPNGVPDGYNLGDTLFLDLQQDESLNNAAWTNTRKWDWADPDNLTSSPGFNDQVYLRLAETYLILAEAQMQLGEQAEAAETINALRRRANASEISASDVTMDFILDERSRELFSEEHRRYTLLRTNTWFDRVKLYNPIAGPNITNRDVLFPIPQDVIDANIDRDIEQNPGY
ncbi:MAG: RagB/SusD family nutrient uptake outer membrane protein [Bacteroidota bacterium]